MYIDWRPKFFLVFRLFSQKFTWSISLTWRTRIWCFFAYLGGHGLSIGLPRASNPPFFSYSGEEPPKSPIQRPPGLVGFPNQLHRLAHDPLPQSTKFWPIINCTSHCRAKTAFSGDPNFDPLEGGGEKGKASVLCLEKAIFRVHYHPNAHLSQ